MDYQIIHCDSQGVRLRRTNTHKLFSAMGILFAALFGSIGASMALFGEGRTFYMGLAFSIAALLFAIGPALLIGKRAELDPREIIFDNEAALIVVMHGGPDTPRAFLPYDDALGFAVRKDRQSSSMNNTTVSTPIYTVLLKLRYGGVWDLLTYTSEEAAATTCALLQGGVKLDKPCPMVPEPTLPAHFRVESDSSLASLVWQNPFPVGMLAFITLFFGTFFSLMFLFRKVSPETAGHPDWILRIMFGFGVFIAIAVLWSVIRSATSSQRVAVTADALTVQRLSRSGEATNSKSLPTAEVVGVGFDFGDSSGAAALRVLDAQAMEAMARLQEGEKSFGAAFADLKTAMRHRVALDVGMLTMAERLNVMRYLNRAVRARKADAPKTPVKTGTPSSFWWESVTTLGASSSPFGRLTSNGTLGALSIIVTPMPMLMLFSGAMMIKNTAYRALMLRACFALEAVACVLALIVAVRLLRAGKAYVRAGGSAVCAVLVVVQLFLKTSPTAAGWPLLFMIPFSIAAGIGLLTLPEE